MPSRAGGSFARSAPPRDIGGQRRRYVEQFYRAIDFTDARQVLRIVRVYEGLLRDVASASPEDADRFVLTHPHLRFQDLAAIATTLDATEIPVQIERIESAIETDPALAIGTAKELVESACRTILAARGASADRNADVPQLTKAAMKALRLLPDDVPDSAKGAEAIRRTSRSLASVVTGLAEMRNLYGSGHGRGPKISGLTPRHAKLAAGAAAALAVFLFETHEARGDESQS